MMITLNLLNNALLITCPDAVDNCGPITDDTRLWWLFDNTYSKKHIDTDLMRFEIANLRVKDVVDLTNRRVILSGVTDCFMTIEGATARINELVDCYLEAKVEASLREQEKQPQ